MLSELQQYMKNRSIVSVAELAQALQIDRDVLREMLQLLMRKDRVRAVERKKCGGCQSCDPAAVEFYEWIQREQ